MLAGSDSAAAGAAGLSSVGPPVARSAGQGGGAGVASRCDNICQQSSCKAAASGQHGPVP